MKKILSLLLLGVGFTACFGQSGIILSSDNMLEGSLLQERINSSKMGKTLTYDDILGSPYVDKNFREAKIADGYQNLPVRYNSYKDEVEFKGNSGIMVIPKEQKFNTIEILDPSIILVYLNTNDENSGYFYKLNNGKILLYKKIITKFIDVIPASSSYTEDKPANFKTLDPIYYIQIEENKFIKKPKTKKDFLNQIPSDKKEILNTYFNNNKVKFDKEEDLKKLVQFLDQN